MSNDKDKTIQSTYTIQSNNRKSEFELLQKLTSLVAAYQDYEAPHIRSDGDIIISLNSGLKRNRQVSQSLADAVRLMMDRDKSKSYR